MLNSMSINHTHPHPHPIQTTVTADELQAAVMRQPLSRMQRAADLNDLKERVDAIEHLDAIERLDLSGLNIQGRHGLVELTQQPLHTFTLRSTATPDPRMLQLPGP